MLKKFKQWFNRRRVGIPREIEELEIRFAPGAYDDIRRIAEEEGRLAEEVLAALRRESKQAFLDAFGITLKDTGDEE